MTTTRRALRARKDPTVTDSPRDPVLSKNLAFSAIAIIVILGIIGVVLLYVYRPEAVATFIGTIVTLAGILTTAITMIYSLGKIGERVQVVERQTNGTLSALREENDRLTRENVELARQVPTSS